MSREARADIRRHLQFRATLGFAGFMAWEILLNILILDDIDRIAASMVNTVSIASYSALLGLLIYNAGVRETRLIDSGMAMLEHLPMGVSIVDREFRFDYINPEFSRIIDFRRRDLLGRRVAEFIHPVDAERVAAEQTRRSSGESASYQVRMLKPDGTGVEVVVTAIPFMKGDAFDGAIAVMADVSMYLELEKARERYEGISAFLLDAVTHDLSNSLQTVVSRTELAANMAERGETAPPRLTRMALEAAMRSAKLIREVKQVAAAELEEWPKNTIAVGALLDGAWGLLPTDAACRTRLDTDPAVAALEIQCNELATMAVSKLMEEAAGGRDAGPVRASAAVRPGDGHGPFLGLTIRAPRASISATDAARLVEPLSMQARNGAQWHQGVGLQMARTICDRLGWRLTAAGLPGGGIVFDIEVPRPQAPLPMGQDLPLRASPPRVAA